MGAAERIKQIQEEERAKMADIATNKVRNEKDPKKEMAVKAFQESGILQSFKEIREKVLPYDTERELINCAETNAYDNHNRPYSIFLQWGSDARDPSASGWWKRGDIH